jgi:hypothetical protein
MTDTVAESYLAPTLFDMIVNLNPAIPANYYVYDSPSQRAMVLEYEPLAKALPAKPSTAASYKIETTVRSYPIDDAFLESLEGMAFVKAAALTRRLDESKSTSKMPNDIRPGTITRQIRELTDHLNQIDYNWIANELFDIANAVERLEGNFLALANITAATADDLAEIKTIGIGRLNRHYGILETVAKMLKGIPSWNYPSKPDHIAERVDRILAALSIRLKKVPRP